VSAPRCGCLMIDAQGVPYAKNINLNFCSLHAAAREMAKALRIASIRYHEQSAHGESDDETMEDFRECGDIDCARSRAALQKAGWL
jgi:hypothetical protein